MKTLSREEILSVLNYDPETGRFRFKRKPHDRGWVNGPGYLVLKILGREFYAHRVAVFLETGEWPVNVDHENRIKLDNRAVNLRPATVQQNNYNRRCRSDSLVGVKGISRHGPSWRARIRIDGSYRCLGSFGTIAEAAEAYDRAASLIHGEFAYAGPVRASLALAIEENGRQ